MNTRPHLEESLQRGIDLIRAKIAEMAALDARAVEAGVKALVERDRQLAYSVILRDHYIDDLETQLDRLCLEFLVRQQPVAGHLRFAFATIKINKELERIGDYAESVARQTLKVSALEPQPPYGKFIELGTMAVHMLRDAVQAFLKQDAELARRTMAIEEQANTLRHAIEAELSSLRQAGQIAPEAVGPLTTVAWRLERVTDQTKNLCEEALYLCTGEFMKHPGAEAFRILFLDQGNDGLSQMAEGIGNALGQARFVFSSAGIAPQPLDARVVAFMESKGIDLSCHRSKTVEQVPHWERYQVMIALSEAARQAFPSPPTKTICLSWLVADPLRDSTRPEGTRASLESAFRFLDSHIRELVEAIRGEPSQLSQSHSPLDPEPQL